jgi:anti-sigma regulatory factor (Ser/Thr protein kinase)
MVLLPHAPSSVGTARRELGADLRTHGIPESLVADAILVLSELMSNAVRHADPLPGTRVRVAWTLTGGSLEIAVSDGGGRGRPHSEMPSVTSTSGRGLGIVEHLSSRWGVRTNEPVGSTVWATLPVTANGTPKPNRTAQPRARRSPPVRSR